MCLNMICTFVIAEWSMISCRCYCGCCCCCSCCCCLLFWTCWSFGSSSCLMVLVVVVMWWLNVVTLSLCSDFFSVVQIIFQQFWQLARGFELWEYETEWNQCRGCSMQSAAGVYPPGACLRETIGALSGTWVNNLLLILSSNQRE